MIDGKYISKSEEDFSPDLKTLLFSSKNFLSFHKDERVTKLFFNRKIDKDAFINVTFVVEPIKEEEAKSKTKHLISNIDIDATGVSYYNEAEVLFLPMTFFEIIDITETTKRKLPCAEITMKYLVDIENTLDDYLKKLAAIEKERPDALLPNLGGQTGLNMACELNKAGVLEKYGVKNAGIDEKLKASDQMKWVGMMNALKNHVEELIWEQVVYR